MSFKDFLIDWVVEPFVWGVTIITALVIGIIAIIVISEGVKKLIDIIPNEIKASLLLLFIVWVIGLIFALGMKLGE